MTWPRSLTMKGIVLLLTASRLWATSDSGFIECAEHPVCLLQGFDEDGFCCPDLDGVYQDCCHRAECVVYPACVDAGLEGFCCPTVEGEFLGCCEDPATFAPSAPPSKIPSSYPTSVIITAELEAECANNAQCDALGLEGLCCPTQDGVYLDCCGSSSSPTASSMPTLFPTITPDGGNPVAECSANTACADLGLTGQCCPTTENVILDCCNGDPTTSPPTVSPVQSPSVSSGPSQCSANSACATLGIEGECCPTVTGLVLDCCDQAANTPTSTQTKSPTDSPVATGPTQCSSNPVCATLGLEGECCPTSTGLILDCCDGSTANTPTRSPTMNPTHSPVATGPAQCSSNPVCAALGLEGECCPTSTGFLLDCCEESVANTPTSSPTMNPVAAGPAQCSSNPVCASLGLEGECCPTSTGLLLDCCDGSVANTPTSKPSMSPTDSPVATGPAQCSTNPVCATLGLEGECCPTSTGFLLDCCEESVANTPTRTPSMSPTGNPVASGPAQCSSNPVCASLGLEGECCPTSTGLLLDCCEESVANTPTSTPSMSPTGNPVASGPAQCSSNPVCASLGLEGECCPTSTGFLLDCCEESVANTPTRTPSMSPTGSPVATGPAQCSSNPVCASLGLEGECCPTSTGLLLDCCEESVANTPTRTPSVSPTSSPEASASAQCSANSVCANLGLEGECCPTSNGVQLDCCDQTVQTPTITPSMSPSSEESDTPSQTPTIPLSMNPTAVASDSPSHSPSTTPGPAQCSVNSVCASLGLEGACCPTVTGVLLDCCTQDPTTISDTPSQAPSVSLGPAQCSSYPVCASLGLEGECCPTTEGVVLDCCNGEFPIPTVSPTMSPSNTPSQGPTLSPVISSSPAQCSTNAACASIGLEGECCPTPTGIQLDCCDESPSELCSANTACAFLALEGECCPTSDGVFLDCCNVAAAVVPTGDVTDPPAMSMEPECSANQECSALGLTGFCCPTDDDVMLDCCYAEPSKQPSPFPSWSPSDVPSNVPSQSSVPTGIPSDVPSQVPSISPSQKPTGIPSAVPSQVPSGIPSEVPSEVPSTIPSQKPSSMPSGIPSQVPSDVPSKTPTSIPSAFPSQMPTVVASDSPSDVPSTSASPTFPAECSAHQECAALQLTGLCCPTTDDVMLDCCFGVPSAQPTPLSSESPSAVPSGSPSQSLNPSTVPSRIPTQLPSDTPSNVPSASPSTVPSDSPTNVASDTPSSVPSMSPSKSPTMTPSGSPSIAASDLPSNIPSLSPTQMPSDVPSDVPSPSPSEVPTQMPSNVPSSELSDVPSDIPSNTPSQRSIALGPINFDDLGEDDVLDQYEGLTWTNFLVSSTSPTAPSSPLAAVPTDTTASIEISGGVFSLLSIDIAGASSASPVTIRGFDQGGTQTASRTLSFTVSYVTYDLSEFENVARIDFGFPIAGASAMDDWVFA